jgi:uncharacterized protein YukE
LWWHVAPGRAIFRRNQYGAKSGKRKAEKRKRAQAENDGQKELAARTIMAQAIMDPEKVRRFAEELQRFNGDLENRMLMLQARLGALGDSWQDQEHEKFAEEFKQAMKALKRFVDLSKDHTPYLLRKAQRIEEYLHQR